ncbi:MAG TPA: TAXI family TRAP transporter solute-binding subunit [Amycolatopsis sp.]|nr:TAXI family TRAP transporter solute-binding subunit [Amycolatopsis sp.]
MKFARSGPERGISRRTLFAVTLPMAGLLLAGCGSRFAGLRLTITTGSSGAVYNQLGTALATSWAAQLGSTAPTVLTSAGSGQNLDRLLLGSADVGFSAADAAAARAATPDGKRLRALVRMHDDYIQVVVPAGSPIARLADLKGRRVSVGPADSGVQMVASRLLASAGLAGEGDLERVRLNIEASADALARGEIDAFFWSGGIPTEQVTALAARFPVRLVDLSDVVSAICRQYQEYDVAWVPVSAYHLPGPVTTLLLPNFLLVTDRMDAGLAQALTQGVFTAQPALAAANRAARSIDARSGIETVPIPLHPGALAYYRSAHYVSS